LVGQGNGTTVRACGACDLPTRIGHDESAYVAPLPVSYFLEWPGTTARIDTVAI
jgi:hypothetical protein